MEHPVVRWLMTDARRITGSNEFLAAFAERLLAAGVNVARITTGVPILHPQIFSFSGRWEAGTDVTERIYSFTESRGNVLGHSPIRIAYEDGGSTRFRLTDPPQPGEFSILGDLREQKFTDYIVLAVPFADGSHKALTLATRRASGFSDTDVTLF